VNGTTGDLLNVGNGTNSFLFVNSSGFVSIGNSTESVNRRLLVSSDAFNNSAVATVGIEETDTPAHYVLSTAVKADSFARWIMNAWGTQSWGSGAAAQDLYLYRSTTSTMKIDSDAAGGAATLIVNKLTANTIDPVYDIDGTKYATYGLSSIGIREELKGVARLDNGTLSYTIDFAAVEEGSDAWLFWQVIGENMEDISVLSTPGFSGRVWYNKNNSSITFFGNQPGEVSYQLSAPRFDADNWTNIATDDVEGMKIS
jgi:hypothetical protein